MKFIQVKDGIITRGEEGEPPKGGTLFFVDQSSSRALVDGRFYTDNKRANPGSHEIKMKDGHIITVDVDASGKAKQREKGGVDVGTSRQSGDSRAARK